MNNLTRNLADMDEASRSAGIDMLAAQYPGTVPMEAEDNAELDVVEQDHEGLKCVSFNAHGGRSNTTDLLEKFRDYDIICIQEPFWGVIKKVATSKNKEGEEYFQTPTHRNFTCIGAHKDAGVVTYVNRRWRGGMPRNRTDLVKHNNAMLVALDVGDRVMHFLNVYNRPSGFANLEVYGSSVIPYLTERTHRLPHITFMCGDFNSRHPMWDRRGHTDEMSNPRHKAMGDDLIALAQMEMGLQLINKPDGPPTWRSTDSKLRPGVLDLV